MSMDGAIDGAIDRARRDEMFAVLERMEGMFGNAQDAEQLAEDDAEQLAMLSAYSDFMLRYLRDLRALKRVNPNLDALNTFEHALDEEISNVRVWIDRLLPEPDTSTDEEEGDYEGLRL